MHIVAYYSINQAQNAKRVICRNWIYGVFVHRLTETAMMYLFLWRESFAPLSHCLCIEHSSRVWSADTGSHSRSNRGSHVSKIETDSRN